MESFFLKITKKKKLKRNLVLFIWACQRNRKILRGKTKILKFHFILITFQNIIIYHLVQYISNVNYLEINNLIRNTNEMWSSIIISVNISIRMELIDKAEKEIDEEFADKQKNCQIESKLAKSVGMKMFSLFQLILIRFFSI